MNTSRLGFLSLVFLLSAIPPATGIIFQSTGDPAHNTNAPAGAITNSGWQYVGHWGGFLGTVIAPRYFITAKHVGGQVGDPFLFQGQAYTTLAAYDDASSDLRIWRVCGSLPGPHAPIYTTGLEVNRGIIVMGRGTQRGAEVRTGLNNDLKGWMWGSADGVQRWGSNRVSLVIDGGQGLGSLLVVRFETNATFAGPDEAHLSTGDSGGPVFVREGTAWKLAGINYAVDGPYNTTTNGPGFYGAIFDKGGLYEYHQASQMWTNILDLPGEQPSSFYATRIATPSRVAWINGILTQTNATELPPVLQSAASVNASFTDDPAAVVDVPMRTITVPAAGPQRFYRLRACTAYRISQITFNGSNVVLNYE